MELARAEVVVLILQWRVRRRVPSDEALAAARRPAPAGFPGRCGSAAPIGESAIDDDLLWRAAQIAFNPSHRFGQARRAGTALAQVHARNRFLLR
jgi:hypothetical protein